MTRCPNIRSADARFSYTCPCDSCAAWRDAVGQGACWRPILSPCPNVERGAAFARRCPCQLCSTRRSEHSRLAHMARDTEPDELVVEFLVAGTAIRATRVERQAAVAELTRRGWTARRIADRLRITQRSVERLRSREAAEHGALRGAA